VELEQLKIDRETGGRRRRGRSLPKWAVLLLVIGGAALLFLALRGPMGSTFAAFGQTKVKVEKIAAKSPGVVAAATGTSANGYVVAKTRAALSADTPGRIVEMNVQEGSTVKKGDVVARLYADEYAAALARAEADVAVAEAARARSESDVSVAQAAKTRAEADVATADKSLAALRSNVKASEADVAQYEASQKLARLSLERAKSLLAQNVDTLDRVDRAQRDLEEADARVAWSRARLDASRESVTEGESRAAAARAGVSEAESRTLSARASVAESEARVVAAKAARDLSKATLEKTAVRAPFDGVVVLKDAEVGEVVSPNSQGGSSARGSVVTMVDFATLEVQAEVSETTIANVKLGGDARVYLDAYPNKPYRGRVDRVWPTANRTKATIEVRVTFLERDENLRPEMGARVVFLEATQVASDDPRILVPKDSVITVGGQSHVFVVVDGKAKKRAVRTGKERSGKVSIVEGLADGDEMILAPSDKLADGDPVHVDKEGS